MVPMMYKNDKDDTGSGALYLPRLICLTFVSDKHKECAV